MRDHGQACATVPACGKTHQRKEEVLLHGVRCAYETLGRRVLPSQPVEKHIKERKKCCCMESGVRTRPWAGVCYRLQPVKRHMI